MWRCTCCGKEHRGILFAIPDDAWRRISDTSDLRGVLCLWCASDRLVAAGLEVDAEVTVLLPGLRGINARALKRFQEIDSAAHLEARAN